MPKLSAWWKPCNRLARAISEAKRQTNRDKAISDLRSAIEENAHACIESDASKSESVSEAYRILTDLYIQTNRNDQAVRTLQELRGYAFGQPIALDLGCQLLAMPATAEDDLITLSTWLEEAGRLSEAAPLLRTAIEERFRHRVRLTMRLGEVLLALGEYPEAARRYQAAWEISGREGPSLIAPLAKIVEVAPDSQLARRLLGLILFDKGDWAQAADHLAAALELGGLDTPALFCLADANKELGRWPDLAGVLERLLERDGAEAELISRCEQWSNHASEKGTLLYWRAQRVWGDALRKLEHFGEALGHYRLVLDDLPTDEAGREFAQGMVDRLVSVSQQPALTSPAEAYLELGHAHILAGAPGRALEAYQAAVKADPFLKPRAIIRLDALVSTAPALLTVRLQQATWQIEIGDWREALDTLGAIRRELPPEHGSTIKFYHDLLSSLESVGHDAALAAGPHATVFSDTLYALAEEMADDKRPVEAVSNLARVLAAFGEPQANQVLASLKSLYLLDTCPLDAPMVEGDAYLAMSAFDDALAAYLRAPQVPHTRDRICERLEHLALKDAQRPDALIAAAIVCLDTNTADRAIASLNRAFERSRDQTAPIIIERLSDLRRAERCPSDGLLLLASALIHRGNDESLDSALQIMRDLFEADTSCGPAIVTLSRDIQQKANHESRTFVQATLLLGEVLADSQPADAALTYAKLIGHPQVDEGQLVTLLKTLSLQASDLTVESADEIIKQVENLQFAGKEIARMHLLKAETLARTNRAPAATKELENIWADFGVDIADEVVRVSEWLPDDSPRWFLRARIEQGRQSPEWATSWLERVIAQGQQASVRDAEVMLRDLSTQFTDNPTPRLGHAKALESLGHVENAASELGEIAARFESARAEATKRLEALSPVTPAVWLGRAQAHIADRDIPKALVALKQAKQDEPLCGKVYEYLQGILADQPGRSDVLQAIVEIETFLQKNETLDLAVKHARQWLAASQSQPDDVCQALSQIVGILDRSGAANDFLAREARLAWADALFAAKKPVLAAEQLQIVFRTWPDDDQGAVTRCERSLKQSETLSVRLLLVEAYLKRGKHEPALAACRDLAYTEPADCHQLALRCRDIVEGTRSESPSLAADASMALAEWSARQHKAVEAAEACHEAARLDQTQAESVARWLESHSWDETSRLEMLYVSATILRETGECRTDPALFDQAQRVYRTILSLNYEAESERVLNALELFPPTYLAAWEMKLDICVHSGSSHYSRAFGAMEKMLTIFGEQHIETLLNVCAQMDQRETGVYLMRAKIHETVGQLPQAAEALLDLQTVLRDDFDPVERAFRGLIERHSDQYALRLPMGDAYRRAGLWKLSMEVYRPAQKAMKELTSKLIQPYEDILLRLPEDASVRWALAEAHLTLRQPAEAARYMDEIIDLDWSHAHSADEFLAKLVQQHPKCGYGWYVRGKLASHTDNNASVIEHLECALRVGSVPQTVLWSLHQMLGQAYHATHQLESAKISLRKAIALSPDNRTLRQALLAVRLAILDRDIDVTKQELETSSDAVTVTCKLAGLLQQRGNHARAIQILQLALVKADKERSQVHLELARCFESQQQYHLAAASLEAALAEGDLKGDKHKELLCRLAEARRRQLRYDEALAALEKVVALDVTYQNALGMMDIIQRERALAQSQPVALRSVSGAIPFPVRR